VRLTIRAVGRPAPQGSKDLSGSGALLEASRFLPAWRQAVKVAAFRAYRAHEIRPEALPLFPAGSPVFVEMCTFIVQPDQCRAAGTDEPTGLPDIDKLLRATLDALGGAKNGAARVFADDAQVTRVARLSKVRATPEQPAGAIIVISGEG